MDSPLYGKKLALDGDSINHAFHCNGGYARIIAERNGMTLENISVGGATITAEVFHIDEPTKKRHWISRSVERLSTDADYILVNGGVNDAALGLPLGKLTDGFSEPLDDTTFYGAFESMLKRLITRFPAKKIGYVAVHQMTPLFRYTNKPEESYYWAAIRSCAKWGVPVCDLNVSCPAFAFFEESEPALYELRKTYTLACDGWHPNELGYLKYYCDKIEAFLKSL